jgi:hypothetical protein
MAISVVLRNGTSTNVNKDGFILVESSPGFFTEILEGNIATTFSVDGNSLSAAAVSTKIPAVAIGWTGYGSQGSLSANSFLTFSSSRTSVAYALPNGYKSYLGKLTIINEHGQHYGTPVCENAFCMYSKSTSPCIGVIHRATDDGYVFKGWEVRCERDDVFTIASANYSKSSSDNGEFVWSIDSPTDADLSNGLVLHSIFYSYNDYENPTITIRAIYDVDQPDNPDNPDNPDAPSGGFTSSGYLSFSANQGLLTFSAKSGLLTYA